MEKRPKGSSNFENNLSLLPFLQNNTAEKSNGAQPKAHSEIGPGTKRMKKPKHQMT